MSAHLWHDDSPAILEHGAWVLRGNVLRWVAAPVVAEPEPPPIVYEPLQVARPIADMLIACPTCGATASQRCKRANGKAVQSHAARLAPRCCPCGAALAAGKQFCEPCRAENREAQIAAYNRRRVLRRNWQVAS